jgi:hypothetical protein
MMHPIDTATGEQAGCAPNDMTEVIVGYLVTLPNGYQCRLINDLGRAQKYAADQRAVSIERMYVRRRRVPVDP